MNAEEILLAAVEKKTPAERAAYLDGACGSDTDLRAVVEDLLQAHEAAGDFLEQPLFEPTPTAGRLVNPEGSGTVIGPYKLLEQIGEGGMGLVFMAEQSRPVRRRVALKIIKPGMDTRQIVARFEAERQALVLMDHPNIAHVFDGGTTYSGRPYFVMELVRGVLITEFCDQRRLTPRQRLELFVTVCQAVQHAHQKGIIHRDLKPSNVLVRLHDTVAVPKIIDFGIAKATTQPLTERTLFTNFAQMIGTPLYMSPEQVEMNGLDVDTRSDVYALGVLLYELLTGTTPFESQMLKQVGLDELRRMIREEEPPTPSQRLNTLAARVCSTVSEQRGVDGRRLGQMLRGELDWIVMKALEKDRNRRYESASALAADVQRYLNDEAVAACPPSVGYRLRKFARRNRGVLVTVGIIAVILVACTAVSAWQATRARQAQHQAEAHARIARRAVDKMYLQVAEKWLGHQPLMDQVQREFVEEALRFYREFSRQETPDRDSRFEAAMAHQRVGTILLYTFGERSQAQEALLRAQGELRKLSAEYPDESEYLFGLARNYGTLAHTLHLDATGKDLEEEDLRQSVRLLERLVARFPTEPKYLIELARNLGNLCDPIIYGRRWPEVRATVRQVLDLLEPLTRESPKGEHLTSVADAYFHLAIAQTQEGALAEAIESERKAIASYERVAESASSAEPIYQHGLKPWSWHMLGRCYRDLAELLARTKDFEGAEEAAERFVRIYKRLVADFPSMPDFQEGLASCLRMLGEVHKHRGKLSEAEAEFRQASKIEASLRGASGKGL